LEFRATIALTIGASHGRLDWRADSVWQSIAGALRQYDRGVVATWQRGGRTVDAGAEGSCWYVHDFDLFVFVTSAVHDTILYSTCDMQIYLRLHPFALTDTPHRRTTPPPLLPGTPNLDFLPLRPPIPDDALHPDVSDPRYSDSRSLPGVRGTLLFGCYCRG